ncbi:MAG: MBOAT family protein [Bacteroidetes bacterium]|nr:MBOAT family protein [Bacteroidota bacterium]
MLFNSYTFFFFLIVVYLLYWKIGPRNLKAQNVLILVASYVFYGWWDYRFLSLIFISSLVDFLLGLRIHGTENQRARRLFLTMSIVANLGLLGVFKYYNFFVSEMLSLLTGLGVSANFGTMQIILPVGISFYTFQTMSYTIDIYRRQLEPTRDPIAFFSFVSFFPQLVAGPIERAKNLLPQFQKERSFDYDSSVDGLRQILWGLFKKVVIADSCATYANQIFAAPDQFSGSVLLLGVLYFAIQIYGDFSGYSDIAIGTARLFGFTLMRNFAYPYFSRDIAEFWRRWHISLSSWFRDYVYIPLGGNRGTVRRSLINIIVTFTVSGLWHGANTTFIVWGFLNGLYYIPLFLRGKQKKNTEIAGFGRHFPSLREAISMLATFILVLIAWVFFRAPDLSAAIHYLGVLLSPSLFSIPTTQVLGLFWIAVLIAVEWVSRHKEHPLQRLGFRAELRWGAYATLAVLVVSKLSEPQTFIYFQF